MLAFAQGACGQWSRNPSANTLVQAGAVNSDQNEAKILPAPDGGAYVAWLDGIGSGWDTRLQRLDSRGIPQWGPNGVLVGDTAYSFTFGDWGFAVDSDGNALLAWRDDGNVGNPDHIKVQKIDSAGNLLWGAGGVQVTTATGGSMPRVCPSGDGGAIVVWAQSGSRLQRLDAKGVAQWTAGGIPDAPPAGSWFVCDMQAGDSGSAIVLYVKSSAPRQLFAQKYSSAGAKLWNGGVAMPIFDESGNGLGIGYLPAFSTDGAGGAIFWWYAGGGARNAYVQHVNSAGTELFPHNGITIADDIPGQIRVGAAASLDPLTGGIYFFAVETNGSTQSQYRILAQRIDDEGTRAWGNTGVEAVPTSPVQPAFLTARALPGGHGAMAFWYSGALNDQQVWGTHLDVDGAPVWTPGVLEISSAHSGKARLASSLNAAGNGVLLAWSDSRNALAKVNPAERDIFAQNVNLDGSLGLPGDANSSGSVDVDDLIAVILGWGLCPAPPEFCEGDIVTPPRGNGSVDVDDLIAVILNWG
jgi:hypothetical protein